MSINRFGPQFTPTQATMVKQVFADHGIVLPEGATVVYSSWEITPSSDVTKLGYHARDLEGDLIVYGHRSAEIRQACRRHFDEFERLEKAYAETQGIPTVSS